MAGNGGRRGSSFYNLADFLGLCHATLFRWSVSEGQDLTQRQSMPLDPFKHHIPIIIQVSVHNEHRAVDETTRE